MVKALEHQSDQTALTETDRHENLARSRLFLIPLFSGVNEGANSHKS